MVFNYIVFWSAIFQRVGGKEVGLKTFSKSSICFPFGTGIMLAHFHLEGKASFSKDEFIIEHTGFAIKWENSLKIQLGIPSGPPALLGFILRNLVIVS